MKIPRPLLVVALLLLLSSHVASAQDSSANAPANPEPVYPRFLEKSGMQILSATFGSDTTFSDVTDETTKLLNQQPRFYARPEWLGTDPTPYRVKALLIVFTSQNHRYIFSGGEGAEVSVPLLRRVAAEQAATTHP